MTQTPERPQNPYAPGVSYGAAPMQQQYGGAWGPVVPPHLVPDAALASPWIRLASRLLSVLLIVVTLGIGYLVWALVLWGEGTDPAKKICGLRVVKADTGRLCTFGDMVVRSLVMGGVVLWLIGTATFGIGYLVDAFMIFGSRRQRLVDKMAGTLVVLA